ncbi:hypothetical protein CLAFUW4_05464 [Fulvia fulva]|uniref:F-box domain-containing protein n=1 Tax=Passalora fulva TaxID=5499 RepID=A0A9Q8LIU0_PASFU|nr:uncharacterized protein CLAFUR5_05607 [Fulvia fulva]KAK4623603.1 hypothetical protein CLAFUR4_05458 [Fulvia fulva]KAK4625146.1 hypothetical protein CLAFUR0_05466 [Fulvia fulva]UJO18191.1 hypothetical protein CLAFUR5_05607 [Fulvia fulva]WPV14548.1 hypothetical protein CLAFUW4_05464 [Fulvia fulva]WPV30590.1 hypothetical protein CLAFUW7_05462 [Fulvia fulva]
MPFRAGSEVQKTLGSLQSKVATNKKFLDRVRSVIPSDRKPSDRSRVKALEVFGTPELLEHILLQLPPSDILRSQQVSRSWRDGVDGSVRIQRRLGLAPSATGFYYSPLERHFHHPSDYMPFPMLKYIAIDGWNPYERFDTARPVTNEFKFGIDIKLDKAVHIGTRSQAMRLCQVPVKELFFEFSDYGDRYREPVHMGYDWVGPKDLTVGALLDEIHMILENEQWAYGLDWKHLTVEVEAIIELADNDPIVLGRWERHRQAQENIEAQEQWRRAREAEQMAQGASGSDGNSSDPSAGGIGG